jgi:hypothetical protein
LEAAHHGCSTLFRGFLLCPGLEAGEGAADRLLSTLQRACERLEPPGESSKAAARWGAEALEKHAEALEKHAEALEKHAEAR